ncbi:MAG: hypothetical protein AAGI01_13745 [Myxococcota bacterium]
MSDDPEENPFDELSLDPRMNPRELTEALRQRAERALPEERARLQGLWRQLTLKETDRMRWALLAHPRASREGARALEELRERVPPYMSRYKPAPLEPTAQDALVLPRSSSRQLPVRPPTLWEE